jgi:hypothetical protein
LIEEQATDGDLGRCLENYAALMNESSANENCGKPYGHMTYVKKTIIEDPTGGNNLFKYKGTR